MAENGRDEDGDDQRAEQGEDEGYRHGAEHLTFGALECEDREKHHSNDSHAEENRSCNRTTGFEDAVESFGDSQLATGLAGAFGQAAQVRLGHDDRSIDNQAEIDRPKTE